MAEESPNTAQDAQEGPNRAPREAQEAYERPQPLPDVSDIHVGYVRKLGAAPRTARKGLKSVPRRVMRHMRGRSCCRTFLTSMSAVTGDSAGPQNRLKVAQERPKTPRKSSTESEEGPKGPMRGAWAASAAGRF